MKKFSLFISIFYCISIFATIDRRPVLNLINSDAFRSIAHFVYEGSFPNALRPLPHLLEEKQKNTIINNIKAGDIVYIQSYSIHRFFSSVHRLIKVPYIVVSQYGDDVIDKKCLAYLNSPKIIKWFAHNVDLEHPKLVPIPIGIEIRYWLESIRKGDYEAVLSNTRSMEDAKEDVVYMNFSTGTYHKERTLVYDYFKNKDFVKVAGRTNYENYFDQLKSCRYCLSPSGNGVSCHRTWEALLMGCIPILRDMNKKTNAPAKGYDSLYEGLPVIVIKEWSEVTPEFLRAKLEEFESMDLKLEKIYFPYWRDLILSESNKYKEQYADS